MIKDIIFDADCPHCGQKNGIVSSPSDRLTYTGNCQECNRDYCISIGKAKECENLIPYITLGLSESLKKMGLNPTINIRLIFEKDELNFSFFPQQIDE